MKFYRASFFAIGLALNLISARVTLGAETNAVASLTDGWKQVPFKYQIQHPYDLKTADRYEYHGQFLLINVPTGKDAK